jgi:hypothetical protein
MISDHPTGGVALATLLLSTRLDGPVVDSTGDLFGTTPSTNTSGGSIFEIDARGVLFAGDRRHME